jgi:hypothetical protein
MAEVVPFRQKADTLGNLLRDEVIVGRCRPCDHAFVVQPKALVEMWGEDYPTRLALQHVRCGVCGAAVSTVRVVIGLN